MTTARPPHEVQLVDSLPGLPGHTRFLLDDLPGHFWSLQSVLDPAVTVVLCDPWRFFPDYAVDITDDIQTELGLRGPEDAAVLCVVTLDTADRFRLNLVAPLLIHRGTGQGCQVVLSDSGHPVQAVIELASVG